MLLILLCFLFHGIVVGTGGRVSGGGRGAHISVLDRGTVNGYVCHANVAVGIR